MTQVTQVALIGCGDYLRWEIENINRSKLISVKYTYDLDPIKSARLGIILNALPTENEDVIFNDPEIKIVMIFTPPWARKELFQKAAKNGKHIITTKPLAPGLEEARELFNIVDKKVSCAVFYGRTGNPGVEKLKEVLDEGEIGHLALYKEDWFHHYPQWNNWATDPKKNGGPFMDAMIHNLNKSRYLIGSTVDSISYFSDNFAQSLQCNDTECMKINFENGASAYLFITWAADLEVYSLDGNDREHYGLLHMITNKGWYITEEKKGDVSVIRAKKEAEIKEWEVLPLSATPYDEFAQCIFEKKAQRFDISNALKDIEIMEAARNNITRPLQL